MNRKKTLFIAIFIIALGISMTSCQKSWEGMKKNIQTSDRHYVIEQYSGGQIIGTYVFEGTLNDSDGSDGYYFYDEDNTLVEISGDLIIKSTK